MDPAYDFVNLFEHNRRGNAQEFTQQWQQPPLAWSSTDRRFHPEYPSFLGQPAANDPLPAATGFSNRFPTIASDQWPPFPDPQPTRWQFPQETPFQRSTLSYTKQRSLDEYVAGRQTLSDRRLAERTAQDRKSPARGLLEVSNRSRFPQPGLHSIHGEHPLTFDPYHQRNCVFFDATANVLLSTLDLAGADPFRAKLPIAALSFAASPNLGSALSAFDSLNLLGKLSAVTPAFDMMTGVVSLPIHHSLHSLPELVPGNVLRLGSWSQAQNHWLHYYEATLDPHTDLAVVRNRQGWLRKALSLGLTLAAGVSVILAPATFVLTLPLLSLGQSVIDYRIVRPPRGVELPTELSSEEFRELARRFRWRLYG